MTRPTDTAELAQLAEPLRDDVAGLLQRAAGAVWIVSGRRTTAEQIELRREHCGTTWADIWTKPSSQCSPPTAIPGTSQHEKGEAVDLGGDLNLAAQLAPGFGLERTVNGERWHYEAVGTAAGVSPVQALAGTINIGIPNPLGGLSSAVEGAVGSALGALVDPLLKGAGRIALVATLVAGGVGLVVLGGIRGTQGVSS